ncbi:PucR family transcriptional regulator [Smaragdicoccus niigatensis]|uniref:PucR family transcriptional regulator n=1 Tax=Smaragdicoccus niigatensis TaxID=359359 RepID=UPI00037116DC|nr:PucR family transcriptional regulator [Smaragdicoccus niigatensis]
MASEEALDLLRRTAELALSEPQRWLANIDAAIMSAPSMRVIADDPVLRAATQRTNRSNMLHWATAVASDPAARVPANIGAETLNYARDLIRRGMTESTLDSYRIGQNAAWVQFMREAFTLTSDAEILQEVLSLAFASISDFLDATIGAVAARMAVERDELTRGTHAERREVVSLILDGAPIPRPRAEARLGYALTGTHLAAIVWGEDPDSELSDLERASDLVARACGARHRLTVVPSAATLWVWYAGGYPPDADRLDTQIKSIAGVRIALGPAASGIEGFRRSHLNALTTQHMVARLKSSRRVANFTDVQLLTILSGDLEGADAFVTATLGPFATAPADIRQSVRMFVQCQCNASRAATTLHVHRNTMLRHLERADQLLPRPLNDNSVNIAVALDIVEWRDASTRRP